MIGVKRPMNIRKKVSNLKFKIGLLIWEVLLPFGLYWSISSENMVFGTLFAVGILLGMLLLVVFG